MDNSDIEAIYIDEDAIPEGQMSAHSDDDNDNSDFLHFAERDRLLDDFNDYDNEPFWSIGGKVKKVKDVVGENQN